MTHSSPVSEALARTPGAGWVRTALQVNPFAYTGMNAPAGAYADETAYNTALLRACQDTRIGMIAVTDHWRAETGLGLCRTAEEWGIAALPGFEVVSAEGVHLLVLHERRTPVETLRETLVCLGGASECPSHHLGKPLAEMLDQADQRGAFVVAPHVNGPDGLLVAFTNASARIAAWRNPRLRAVAFSEPVNDPLTSRILGNDEHEYRRAHQPAVFRAADVMSEERLREPMASSWFKMREPSLRGLAVACRTPRTRVRTEDPEAATHPRIVAASWDGGFLDGTRVRFSQSLTTVIGARGAGKSVLLESVRHVLGLAALGDKAAEDHRALVRRTLSNGAQVSLVVEGGAAPGQHVVTRVESSQPYVTTMSGLSTEMRPLDVLPGVQVFGQHELAELAESPDYVAALVGGLTDDFLRLEREQSAVAGQLATNRASLVELRTRLGQLDERLSERSRLQSLLEAFEQADVSRLDDEVRVARERDTFAVAVEQVDHAHQAALELGQSQGGTTSFLDPHLAPDAPRRELHERTRAVLDDLRAVVTEASRSVSAAAAAARAALVALDVEWDESTAVLRAGFDEVRRELAASGLQPTEYLAVRRALEALTSVAAARSNIDAQLRQVESERTQLLIAHREARARTRRSLASATTEANQRLRGLVMLRPVPSAARSDIVKLVERWVSRARQQVLAAVDAEDFDPASFAAACRLGAEVLKERYNVRGENATQVLAAGEEFFLRMEELAVPLAVETSLNVGLAGRVTWRRLPELSKGQRATAVLLLLLANGDGPLVIDQPEDDLDNRFVVEGVVERLHALKGRRQLIVATHNANIPVLGDAELVLSLRADPDRGEVAPDGAGSIDDDTIRGHIEQLLEGGRSAFDDRRYLYGF